MEHAKDPNALCATAVMNSTSARSEFLLQADYIQLQWLRAMKTCRVWKCYFVQHLKSAIEICPL